MFKCSRCQHQSSSFQEHAMHMKSHVSAPTQQVQQQGSFYGGHPAAVTSAPPVHRNYPQQYGHNPYASTPAPQTPPIWVPPNLTPAPNPVPPAQAPATSIYEKDEDDENTCKVCFDADINTVIIPCGHLAICTGCSRDIKKSNQCPICRGKITKIVKTYQS